MSDTPSEPASDLGAFLIRFTPIGETEAAWSGGKVRLCIAGYLTPEMPPAPYVSSVRGVILRGDEVLVINTAPGESEIMPGGRVEAGETLEQTLRREVLEETGWTLGPITPIGFIHLRHLSPKPDGYPHPYPDFIWPIYAAEALEHRPEATVPDEYVRGSAFRPIATVELPDVHQRAFLDAAVRALRG